MRRQWLKYKADLKFTALLALAAVGVGTSINVDHMNKSAKYSSDLLQKQWVCGKPFYRGETFFFIQGICELDHTSTVRLLSSLIERNLNHFKHTDLQVVADYVATKTGETTYWDIPSTYLSYSPLGWL